jgi:hypothetical protein
MQNTLTLKMIVKIALKDAMVVLDRTTPTTKKVIKSKSITDIMPIDLMDFMAKNNIPDDAVFDGNDNGYDAWDDILISWKIEVPTTEKDRLDYRRRRFSTLAFSKVAKLAEANKYKRLSVASYLLKELDDNIYDIYRTKGFDRLTQHYALYFKQL